MIKEVKISKELEKGIYPMKPLGGGHLIKNKKKAFSFLKNLDCIDSVAIGMQSNEELIYNTRIFSGQNIDSEIKNKIDNQDRKLYIHNDWCVMCEKCIERCDQNALYIKDDMICVNHEKCVLCSYCSTVCKELAIKII